MFVNGESQGWKRVGRWVNETPSHWAYSAGSYADGKKVGEWIEHGVHGRETTRGRGSYVDGKKDGRWSWKTYPGDELVDVVYWRHGEVLATANWLGFWTYEVSGDTASRKRYLRWVKRWEKENGG